MHTGFCWGEHEGKRPLGRPGRRREDNNKIDLKKQDRLGLHWTDKAEDMDRWWALVNAVMNVQFL
jgi:hypothetical protein